MLTFQAHRLGAFLRERWGVVGAYVACSVVLWPVPLLNRLHAESCAVLAAAAFFIAGLSALRRFKSGASLKQELVVQEGLLVIPWALLTVAMLWAPNCGYAQGLLFFGLFPVVTVVLSVAAAYALSASRWQWKRGALIGGGIAVMLIGPLYDLGLHPQFYTYNHVFGGVLGPIYDEELAVRSGLFAFRGLTLLWAALLVLIGRWLRGQRDALTRWGRIGAVLLIGLCYVLSARLGFNTPAWYLQEQLGGVLRTEHFAIYYAPDRMAEDRLRRLAARHEYHYDRLARRLDVQVEERIRSYLYPDPATKARLTGARRTSVAPVWLPAPQSHLLARAAETSLSHELAHVFSREFGLPLVRASVAVGLVEGLAVALEPASARPSPDEQVAAALLDRPGAEQVSPELVRNVAARLDPFGFWTGRGAVSYTTMGSFVRFLLDEYGPKPLKEAYAWARVEEAYGQPLADLVDDWRRHVLDQPVVAWSAGATAQRRFSRPSLFEKECPHYVPVYRRRYRAGRAALRQADTTGAQRLLRESLRRQPSFVPALNLWAQLALTQNRPADVQARLGEADTLSPALHVRRAEAAAMLGDSTVARRAYAQAMRQLPLYEQDVRAQLLLRQAVAHDAGVIRMLASLDSAHTKAKRLGRAEALPPEGRALQGRLLLESGRAEQATRVLRSVPADVLAPRATGGERALLQRQLLAWQALAAFRADAFERARWFAARAYRHYQEAGDVNAAAQQRALMRRIRWHQRRQSSFLISLPAPI